MMTTIQDLQEELFLKIFSHYIRSEGREKFLINIPRVCKHWNRLSTEASLWKDVFVRDFKFLQHLSRRGLLRNTHSLEFNYNQSFSDVNLSAVLENIEDLKALDLGCNDVGNDVIKLVTKNCPHLERLHLQVPEPTTSHELDQFLTVCGPTLKHLYLNFSVSREVGQQLVSGIASKCPLLETLEFLSYSLRTPFPIHELRRGCPKLSELEFSDCQLINIERKDSSLDCGFKELKKFRAFDSDFSGEDVYFLLKESMNLEHLKLDLNDNLVFGNISKIPSDKVSVLYVNLKDENLDALGDAVYKWRRTLSVLNLWDWICDVSSIFERFLQDNSNPQLKSLAISENIDPHFFQKLIQKCQNLNYLQISWKEYRGREEIEEALELLVKERENCT